MDLYNIQYMLTERIISHVTIHGILHIKHVLGYWKNSAENRVIRVRDF